MAKCKWCNKSGLLFKVNYLGLCDKCNKIIDICTVHHKRVITESISIAADTKNLSTKLSRLNVAKSKAVELLKYEYKGIKIMTPPPSIIIETVDNELNNTYKEYPAIKIFQSNGSDEILRLIKENPGIYQRNISKYFDPSIKTLVADSLKYLVDAGLIRKEKEGSNNKLYYNLKAKNSPSGSPLKGSNTLKDISSKVIKLIFK